MANVNTAMTFNQLATVLSSIVGQATGKTQIVATNTSEFTSQAQTGLLTGYDPIVGAVTQILSRTVFRIRPYSAKFTEIRWDTRKWGNHVRKINFADTGLEEDNRLGRDVSGTFTTWDDGDSVDMYSIKKPSVLQTNWYSQNQYQKHYTIFRDQLDSAFSGPDEFQRFLTGVVSTVADELEQAREEFARAIIANYIGALSAQDLSQRDTGRVFHFCTLFVAEQGLTNSVGSGKTYATARELCLDSTYYDRFIKWLFAKIAVISELFTERSLRYQSLITPTGASAPLPIMRHTPYEKQRMYLFVDDLKNIDTRVLSAAFHDSYLKIGKHNTVSYWQAIDETDRMKVRVTPSTINAAGGYAAGNAQSLNYVFGILFDEEAIGMTQGSTWSSPTPFNARGGYSNVFYHMTVMGLNDLTEKGVLFILD